MSRMTRFLRRALAATGVCALLATSCASDGADGGRDGAATSSDPATNQGAETERGSASDGDAVQAQAETGLQAGVYRLGYVAATSGPVAFAGVPLLNGVRVAVEEINETDFLGEGAELEVHEEDAGGDPATAIQVMQRFIDDQTYLGALCCNVSPTTGSVLPIVKGAEFPIVITVALLPDANEPPYVHRTAIQSGRPGGLNEQMVDVLVEEFAPESVAIAQTADSDGVTADTTVWVDAFEENGVEVLQVIDTFSDDTDFAGTAEQVIALEPDLFLGSMFGETQALLIKQLRDRGFEAPIVGNVGLSTRNVYEVAGDALDGVFLPLPFSADAGDQQTQEFVSRYRDMFDEDPDFFAAEGYMATWMMAHGLKASSDPTREGLAQGLSSLEEIPSVYGGPLVFEDGQADVTAATILEWTADGTLELWRRGQG